LFNTEALEYSLALYAFFSSVLFIYIIYKYLLKKEGFKFFKQSVIVYLSIGIAAALFGLLQYYLRFCCRITIGGVWVIPGFQPRIGSTFWDVNHFGGFLVTMIPLLGALAFSVKTKKYKIGALFSAGLLSLLLFLSQSRSSWVGLMLGLILSVFIFYSSKLRKPIVYGIIVLAIGASGFLGYTLYKGINIREKVASYMHYRLDSTDTHIMLLEGAAEIFLNDLLLGAGYGNFDTAFRETETAKEYFNREPKLREMKVPPHSVWGETLAETGWLGFVTYLSFSVLLLITLITSIFIARDKNLKYIGVGLLSSLFSVFVAGLFYSYNMEFYWVFIFICIAYTYLVLNDKFSIKSVLGWWYERSITPYLIIIPPALLYIFIRLGATTLIDWDEAIYAKVAKNIVQNGEWLSLKWLSKDEYWFEKPPLYMWFTAFAFKLTGFRLFRGKANVRNTRFIRYRIYL
jgi:hypothetical protein